MKKSGFSWLAVIIIALVITGICSPFIFQLGMKYANKDEEKQDKEETKEDLNWIQKNQAMSMAWLDNNLLVLTKDGKKIKINSQELDRNTKLFYLDDKIYAFSFGGNDGSELGYFDLNNNKNYTLIKSFTRETIPESLIVVKNHAYITLAGKNYIIDYDLEEEKDTKLYYFDDYFSVAGHGSFMLYYVNNQVYYLTRGTPGRDPNFGSIDLETGEKEKITNTGYVKFIYHNKFVFNHDYYDKNEYKTEYYEYDTNTKKITKISGSHLDGGGSIEDSMIVPVNDYYIYTTGDGELYQFKDGEEEKLIDVDLFPYTFVKVSEKEILLSEGGLCEMSDCNFKQYIYNIQNNKLKETKDYSDVYYESVEYFE